MKATMTLNEVASAMRDAGIRASAARVADDIETGVYTFGRVTKTSPRGRRSYEIFRVDFYRWLSEKTGGTNE